MITNLLFFVAFLALSYVVSRLADKRHALRLLPVRFDNLAERRPTDDTV
jgi:hypothetical protein